METHNITKKQFHSYEAVRISGVTNMHDIKYVSKLSGLDRETILAIMREYEILMARYPDVRK